MFEKEKQNLTIDYSKFDDPSTCDIQTSKIWYWEKDQLELTVSVGPRAAGTLALYQCHYQEVITLTVPPSASVSELD